MSEHQLSNRQQFFVHVVLNGKPVVAGYHEINSSQSMGTFIYGRSYCDNPNAYPIDPINLPLIYDKPFHFPMTRFSVSGIPGALLDCGPDEWGKRILNRFSNPKPVSIADYLVLGSSYGVGALQFSDTPNLVKQPLHAGQEELEHLYLSAVTFDTEPLTQEQLQPLLMPSSGIGGARPKAHILNNGTASIAKFNRRDDIFDNALAEFCMMQIAKKIGINTAKVELVKTEHGHALIVERFDILPNQQRRHMLSANALLNIQDIAQLNDVSYDRITAIGKQISRSETIAQQVFTRMLFNIAIGNTDDHTRNHAFLKHATEGSYDISPAYDIVPLPQRLGSHAINIGPFGQSPTLDNIKSSGKLMGLSIDEQKECAAKVYEPMKNIEATLMSMGVTEEDTRVLKPSFERRYLLDQL